MKNQKKFIWITKINSKGQIVIPAEARKVFNIKLGENLLLLGDVDKGIAIAKPADYLDFASAVFNTIKGENDDKN